MFHWLQVSPRLSLFTCFPALVNGNIFSRAFHWLHVSLVTCFPALITVYMFPRTFHCLHVFPRFSPFTCFPALVTWYMYFPHFSLVPCFHAHSCRRLHVSLHIIIYSVFWLTNPGKDFKTKPRRFPLST